MITTTFKEILDKINEEEFLKNIVSIKDIAYVYLNELNIKDPYDLKRDKPKKKILMDKLEQRTRQLKNFLENQRKFRLSQRIYTNIDYLVNDTIKHIFVTNNDKYLKDQDGNVVTDYKHKKPQKLNSQIRIDEAFGIYTLIKNLKTSGPLIVVEIGFAYGISSLFIGEGIRQNSLEKYKRFPHKEEFAKKSPPKKYDNGNRHIILDPFQYHPEHKWRGVGVKHMNQAQLPFDLRQQLSYIEMANLIDDEKLEGKCSVIFIDGAHAFDYTLMDLFLADKLLKIGGYIIIDDGQMEPVMQALAFCSLNYWHWKLESVIHGNIVIIKKMAIDKHTSGQNHNALFSKNYHKIKPNY